MSTYTDVRRPARPEWPEVNRPPANGSVLTTSDNAGGRTWWVCDWVPPTYVVPLRWIGYARNELVEPLPQVYRMKDVASFPTHWVAYSGAFTGKGETIEEAVHDLIFNETGHKPPAS